MSFQLEERRVSEDGFAYSKEEFSLHYTGLAQWNAASIETKYDRDGNTYTQRAFFEHYGGVDQWYSAIPANAYSDSRKPTYHKPTVDSSTATTTAATSAVGGASSSQPHTHTAYHDGWYSDRSTGSMGPTGWSSDRGPQANPDDGFFDTQGYGDHYISYDDMAISSNLYSHMAGRGQGGSSSRRASRDRLRASSSSSSSSARPSTSVPRGTLPSLRNTNRRGLSRSNSNTSMSSSNSGGGGTTGARPSTSSHSSSPLSSSPNRGKRRRSGRVERSLSSLGRKLFSHIPPKQLKVMVTPTNANNSNSNSNKRKTTAHLDDGLSSSATSMSTSTPSLYERKQKLLNNKNKSKRHPASLLAADVSPLSKSTSTLPLRTTPSLLPAINTPSPSSNNTSLSGASINIDDYISVHCNVTKRFRLCRVLDMRGTLAWIFFAALFLFFPFSWF